MENIAVIEDQEFEVEFKIFGHRQRNYNKYFMVRATKGEE